MKSLSFFFTLLCFPLILFATDCIPDCDCETDWTLEVRGAYYYLPNPSLRRVYTCQWIDYQVETAKRVHDFVEVWGGVNWASKQGHTSKIYAHHRLKNTTKLFIVPISIGLKFLYPILPFIDIYAGAGICYSFLKMRNFRKDHVSYYSLSESPLKKRIYKNEIGGVFKVGFQFAMSASTFLDFFADYYTQRFHLSHHNEYNDIFKRHINCSGFKFGAGFGVYF